MKERLASFIKSEGLSNSRFSELMGVGSPRTSHILNGRNQPSFDFIEGILKTFPRLNPEWLILGIGEMYRDNTNVNNVVSPSTNVNSGHSINEPILNFDPNNTNNKVRDLPDSIDPSSKQASTVTASGNIDSLHTPDLSVATTLPVNMQDSEIAGVIILYRNGSFRHYSPLNTLG